MPGKVPTVRVEAATGRALASGRQRELRLPVSRTQEITAGGEVKLRSPGHVHCRAKVAALRWERLGDVDAGAARREGFRGVEHFTESWEERNGPFDPEQPVAVLELEALPEVEERFLAERPGRGGDYVTNPHRAMREEGAAIDGATQARFSREGRERHASRLARDGAKVRRLPAAEQAAALEAQARARHVDVRSDLRQFRYLVERQPQQASRHLESVRQRLGV